MSQLTFEAYAGWEAPPMRGNVVAIGTLDRPIWTETKAQLINEYLRLFLYITKHGAYIDGFAGPQDPENPESWAARLALQLRPPFLRQFYLCEFDSTQYAHLQAMLDTPEVKAAIGKRAVIPQHADFNEWVASVLQSGEITDTTATFALLDQRTFECKWRTVQELAAHKKGSTKIELFYFFPSGWLGRAMSAVRDRSILDDWWGDGSWEQLQKKNMGALAEIIMERIRGLGYADVKAWPITGRENGQGRVMYHMVHATDHLEAPKLMYRAYRKLVATPIEREQLKLGFEDLDDVAVPE